MPSLRARYVKEREGFDTLETIDGFAEYKLFKDECYLRDIYVVPDKRKSDVATQLADRVSHIAKAHGCKFLTGSVSPQANGATESLKVLLAYGFKLRSASPELIIFSKDIL
jgi:GNAT superfamily N-acetyltransferase